MTAKNKIIFMKFVLSCFFVLASLLSFSQDLIITRDSTKIFCEIIKEDSSTIYYKQVKGDAVFKLSINKSEVLNYSNSKAMVQSQIRKADSIAFNKPKCDSILFVGKTKFKYQGKIYGRLDATKLMKDNLEAYKLMKQANGFYFAGKMFDVVGGVFLGVAIADLVTNNTKYLFAEAGVGVGTLLVSIAFKTDYYKHAFKAIKIYNSKLKIAGTTVPKFEFGMATRGLGVSLKF